jgi:Trypsin-like peptidase domain
MMLGSTKPDLPKDVSIETIRDIMRSVVPVVCGYMDANNRFQLVGVDGSGFFVDRLGHFITAGHVLDDWKVMNNTRHACSPAIYVPDHGWKTGEISIDVQSFTFVSCDRDSDLDLAVCQTIDNPFTSSRIIHENIAPIEFDTEIKAVGTPIAFTGFPLESVSPLTSKGFIAGFTHFGGATKTTDYVIDKSAWPGASGSLLYIGNGKAIGIILAAGFNQGSGLAYAKTATSITTFLGQHSVNTKQ